MCGILVVLSKNGELDQSACRRALATMHWRGPDFSYSSVWNGRLFMGQTVLSITGDPDKAVGDYHRSRSGRYELLYNGEIYNFNELATSQLKSESELLPRFGTDTEVLANLHDVLTPESVPRLFDGMFAYVAFDREARRVHLVRDVQGEKSLYVHEDDTRIIIASEISAIRALVPEIPLDLQALRDYFRTRHLMLFERTVHQNIRQLRSGHIETLDLDALTWTRKEFTALRDWIDPDQQQANGSRSMDDLTDELDALMSHCVREMIPKGRAYSTVVSGGVDSSLISHYVLAHGNPDMLIAVNHVGKDLISTDLSSFERTLGRSINVLQIDKAAYTAEIPRCQKICGAPLHSHSYVPQALQSAAVRASGCRVLFGGDGADEFFGGYPAYVGAVNLNGRYSPSPYTAHETPRLEFLDDHPEQFQGDLESAWADGLDAYAFVESPEERAVLAMMYCDAVYQLPEVGLRGADLMSMLWSVETRSVFLRRSLMQFALNLPLRMKADPLTLPLQQAKPLLKHLFIRHYSIAHLFEKQGFAGFPNESALYLGNPQDYCAPGILGVVPSSIEAGLRDRATAWKLINTEYFLRYHD